MRSLPFSASALLLAASATMANLDLANLYTQTVKQGQSWAYIDTKVEALDLDLTVNHGVVTTTATFSYAPGPGVTQTWKCVPVQCVKAPCAEQCDYTESNPTNLDSLETTGNINLQDNGAITDMYLWVGDVKVRAELQSRALASAQYEDIVKRRKDPALLETWGSGYYTLRIFPGQSGQTRKLQITFVQGMEDDKGGFAAILPVLHSLAARGGVSTSDLKSVPHKSIGKVTLKAVSTDGRTYGLAWPGLGQGKVGATALVLSAANLEELKEGTLSGTPAACAGCLTPWISERSGTSFFGVKTLLTAATLKLEDQPKERCVILDVDASDPLAPERARKLALLALKAYGQSPYAANLALSDGNGGLEYVFDAAVAMEGENLTKAFAAIKAWQPVAKADAHAALTAYAKGRKSDASEVAVLINNDPYAYYPYPVNYNPSTMPDVEGKARDFEAAQAARADKLTATLKTAHAMLFGFWNDWHLNLVAEATGGFNLGGINGWIYPPYYWRGGVVDVAATDVAKPAVEWVLPPLFGPGRPDAYGIQDLKVTLSGMTITDLVVLQGAQRWWYGPMMMDMAVRKGSALAKSSDFAPGYGNGMDSIPVRIGGRFQGSGKVSIKLTGLWGGLRFTQQFSVDLTSPGAGPDGAPLWAYQQSEAWGRDGVSQEEITDIQKLGKDYHVINSQISLLALEPGMTLWAEMPAKPGSSGGAETANPSTDSKLGIMARPGMNMDSASLEDILAGKVTGIAAHSALRARPGALTVRASGGGLELAWEFPAAAPGERARFRILDVTGRSVVDLTAVRGANGFSAKWPGYHPGIWLLRAESGRTVVTKKLSLAR